jgi:hypothetical protein
MDPERVELFGQALDRTTLARGIPVFERNDAAPPLEKPAEWAAQVLAFPNGY